MKQNTGERRCAGGDRWEQGGEQWGPVEAGWRGVGKGGNGCGDRVEKGGDRWTRGWTGWRRVGTVEGRMERVEKGGDRRALTADWRPSGSPSHSCARVWPSAWLQPSPVFWRPPSEDTQTGSDAFADSHMIKFKHWDLKAQSQTAPNTLSLCTTPLFARLCFCLRHIKGRPKAIAMRARVDRQTLK